MKASKLVPRDMPEDSLYFNVVSSFLLVCARVTESTDSPVLSQEPWVRLQMCYCAHPYGGFWKAQLSSSHKKQTPWSLVQYLSLIARKSQNCLSLKDILVLFGAWEHAWALFFCIMCTLAANLQAAVQCCTVRHVWAPMGTAEDRLAHIWHRTVPQRRWMGPRSWRQES